MELRKPLDIQASSLMIVLCMIWGIQQVVIKIAATDISPMMQIAIRSGLAALLVFPLIQRNQWKNLYAKEYLLPGMGLATFFAIEYVFVAEALRYTSAAHTVVLLYTAPIFVALGLNWKLPSEKLTYIQWGGIFIAFLGIVLSFVRSDHVSNAGFDQMLLGDFFALLGGVMWAFTTITLRLTRLSEVAPTQILFYQLLGAFIILLPMTYVLEQTVIHWSNTAIWSMVFQVVVISLLSLMAWFWLLKNYLANSLGVFSFLTPVFGVLFGIIFLGEKIELNFIFGSMMVMLGILIMSLHKWIRRIFRFSKPVC
ncbi:DMT family transporter [Acinetobacter sp. ANC 4558]|uniref:DMT family transporter n=1 Tax=Acinetobacter sp. ANC 4558 TaxID=1977876 RepID=UPI00148A5A09|nr:DMT family transporter [Acinetobacter sp. ANC 4558]